MDYEGVAVSLVNRSEAHAVRLALIYALCSGHTHIEVDDLKAALAIVDYARKSAFRIFGGTVANKRKSKILDALEHAVGGEMTVTEISTTVFSHNLKSDDLHNILSEMESAKLVSLEKAATGGAPKTVVKIANVLRNNEINEITPFSAIQSSHPLNSLNTLIRTRESEIECFTEDDFPELVAA
jgi:hypothetical protein